MRDAAEVSTRCPAPADERAAPERLRAWLLAGPAQRREGAHEGAVAGVIEAHGDPTYVYPEITGYFLQWLAWRVHAGDDPSPLAARAAAAQAWLARWAAQPAPPARVYLAPRRDWRNAGLFQFDVAIVLRGIGGAAAAGLVTPDRKLIERLDALLRSLIAPDGALDACRAHEGESPLPLRWSTMRGPFLAKAADGVLAAGDLPGVSAALIAAAQRTFDAARTTAEIRPHAESHPLLYAIEGLLARADDTGGRGALAKVAVQVQRLLAAAAATGRIAESAHAPGQARLDVQAQALRAGCLLAALGVRGAPARATLDAVADALAQRVTPMGSLPFSAATATAERNVWTAMFAEQALTLATLPDDRVARCTRWII